MCIKIRHADKQNIIWNWRCIVENTLHQSKLYIALDSDVFLLDNTNDQCMIHVYNNNTFIGEYTHIESFLLDLENCIVKAYKTCKVYPLRKRKLIE